MVSFHGQSRAGVEVRRDGLSISAEPQDGEVWWWGGIVAMKWDRNGLRHNEYGRVNEVEGIASVDAEGHADAGEHDAVMVRIP